MDAHKQPPKPPNFKLKLPPIGFYFRRYILYETRTRLYLIGRNATKTQYRVLKIDRTNPNTLSIVEDEVTYSRKEITDLLGILEATNKTNGGIRKLASAYSVLGFIRFTAHYYIYLVTKKKHIGNIGHHRIYSIEETVNFPVAHVTFQEAIPADEERYKSLFFRFDLTQDFYYSPTYDLTCSLQQNMTKPLLPAQPPKFPSYNDTFSWNHYLLSPLISNVSSECWTVPLIHGSFVQHTLDLTGRTVQLTVIARRSRFFAGARFIKRGLDEQGHVANDVEMEQILTDPNMGLFSNQSMSGYVQHRGSIPLYWAQINAGVMPKPPITLQRSDPFYSASILHFMDLMKRYGSPLIVLNLIKSKERIPREMILRDAYGKCIEFINGTITDESKRILYIAWDFKKAAKNNKLKLQRDMYAIAQMSILRTGFFHAFKKLYNNELRTHEDFSPDPGDTTYGNNILKNENDDSEEGQVGRLQCGAVRTNCIDSIDRTNAAQYLLGLCALSHQLYSMGLIQSPDELTFDSGIALVLMEMYEIAGHQLALQYGGSGLAHTMNTFVTKSLVDHSKDFWTVVQRYYRNAFTDQEKQHSINVFLGVFRPWEQKNGTDLWSLESDYHLHMFEHERELICTREWWVEPLQQHEGIYRRTKLSLNPEEPSVPEPDISYEDFYNIHKITSFDKLLDQEFIKPRKVGVAIPMITVKPEKEKSEGLGIMRWLWNSKTPSPSQTPFPSGSGRNSPFVPNTERPLAWCGMDILVDPNSTNKYSSYCDVSKLDHRLKKKRKRYNNYKEQYTLTHYRRPKIGHPEYVCESRGLFTKLVAEWQHYKSPVSASDIDLYSNYVSFS